MLTIFSLNSEPHKIGLLSTHVLILGTFFFCNATSFEKAESPPPDIAEKPDIAELFDTTEGSR